MCTSHDHDLGEAPQAGAGRRSFLRATALLGATAGAVAALPAVTAVATPSSWRPDPHSRRFTLAVMPDTQYLFDGPSIDKAPVEASLRYLLEHGKERTSSSCRISGISRRTARRRSSRRSARRSGCWTGGASATASWPATTT
ncbi:hypothetical protein GCM10011428_26890 [Streptomyces violaceus]